MSSINGCGLGSAREQSVRSTSTRLDQSRHAVNRSEAWRLIGMPKLWIRWSRTGGIDFGPSSTG